MASADVSPAHRNFETIGELATGFYTEGDRVTHLATAIDGIFAEIESYLGHASSPANRGLVDAVREQLNTASVLLALLKEQGGAVAARAEAIEKAVIAATRPAAA